MPDLHDPPMPEDGLPTASVQQLVFERMQALKLNARALSRRIGKNDAYINQFLGRGKPRVLPEDAVASLAHELDVEPWRLRSNGKGPPCLTSSQPKQPPSAAAAREPTPTVAVPAPQAATIALYRVGATLDMPLATMPAMPQQARASTAFAVLATASGGLLRLGNIAYCIRGAPIRPGDNVVVILGDRIGGFAELVEMVGDKTTLCGFDYGTGTTIACAELAKVVALDVA